MPSMKNVLAIFILFALGLPSLTAAAQDPLEARAPRGRKSPFAAAFKTVNLGQITLDQPGKYKVTM